MKKSTLLIIILLVLVIAAVSFLLWRNARLELFCLPFEAGEIESVTVSSVWNEYKLIRDEAGIRAVTDLLNKLRLYPNSADVRKDLPAGSYGYEILFKSKDGLEYTYSVIPLGVNTSVFTDASGSVHKARGISADRFWNRLDYEIQTKTFD